MEIPVFTTRQSTKKQTAISLLKLFTFCYPMFQEENYFHFGLPLPLQHQRMSLSVGKTIGGKEESSFFPETLG